MGKLVKLSSFIGIFLLSATANASWYVGKTFATMVSPVAVNMVTLGEGGKIEFVQYTAGEDEEDLSVLSCSGKYDEEAGTLSTQIHCGEVTYTQQLQLGDSTEAELREGKVLMAQSSLIGPNFIPAPFLVVEDQEWTVETLHPVIVTLATIGMSYEPEM